MVQHLSLQQALMVIMMLFIFFWILMPILTFQQVMVQHLSALQAQMDTLTLLIFF